MILHQTRQLIKLWKCSGAGELYREEEVLCWVAKNCFIELTPWQKFMKILMFGRW